MNDRCSLCNKLPGVSRLSGFCPDCYRDAHITSRKRALVDLKRQWGKLETEIASFEAILAGQSASEYFDRHASVRTLHELSDGTLAYKCSCGFTHAIFTLLDLHIVQEGEGHKLLAVGQACTRTRAVARSDGHAHDGSAHATRTSRVVSIEDNDLHLI